MMIFLNYQVEVMIVKLFHYHCNTFSSKCYYNNKYAQCNNEEATFMNSFCEKRFISISVLSFVKIMFYERRFIFIVFQY